MANNKFRVIELLEVLKEEQLKTEHLLSQVQKRSQTKDENTEIHEKYRLLKKKLIMANIELLKVKGLKQK